MKTLVSLLNAPEISLISHLTNLRLLDRHRFKDAESIIAYEQGFMDKEKLKSLCEKEYGCVLELTKQSYVTDDLKNHFEASGYVPLSYDVISDTIHVACLPEMSTQTVKPLRGSVIHRHYVPLFWYSELYQNMYGKPDFLLRLPAKDLFDLIVQEALQLGAMEFTLEMDSDGPSLFYNVKLDKVMSKRKITKADIQAIGHYISVQAGAPFIEGVNIDGRFAIELPADNRGRVEIGTAMHGLSITLRILPPKPLPLDKQNHSEKTYNFIKDNFQSIEAGLRIMIGPTGSGKNFTLVAAIWELAEKNDRKIIVVGNPIEIMIPKATLYDAVDEEDFKVKANSTLRSNPKLAYITELNSETAYAALQQANTGKAVLTTVHANSIADLPARIADITGMSIDSILQVLHSAIYQELHNVNGVLTPKTTCVKFDRKLKQELENKTDAQVRQLIRAREEEWGAEDNA